MERQTESTRPLAQVLLTAAALFLGAACSTPATRTETEAQSPQPQPPPPAARPVVLTQIKTEQGSCTPEFENDNCGAAGDPGDICLAAGTNANPTRASLKFVVAGPGANTAEFHKMTIGTGAGWDCPSNTGDDFPDFVNCEFIPPTTGNVMQVKDDNQVNRIWNYSITMKARAGCSPVTIHPIIQNGGGNASTGDDPP